MLILDLRIWAVTVEVGATVARQARWGMYISWMLREVANVINPYCQWHYSNL